MLGYPAQTGDSGEEEGEEALPKGATKTILKRNRMEQANDDDMDDDGKYIFGYEIVKAKCNQIHTIHVEFGDPTYDEGEEDEEEDEEEEEDGDKGNLTT